MSNLIEASIKELNKLEEAHDTVPQSLLAHHTASSVAKAAGKNITTSKYPADDKKGTFIHHKGDDGSSGSTHVYHEGGLFHAAHEEGQSYEHKTFKTSGELRQHLSSLWGKK